jgi:hypothetical protein
MTNLEAIKGNVGYPLSDNAFKLALLDRGLNDSDTYSATSKAFELASADAMVKILTSPDVKEGSYSVTVRDTKTLMSLASGIYKKYGESDKTSSLKPKATFKSSW